MSGSRRASRSTIAVESVLAVSLLYEVFEWLLTLTMHGPLADAYNGQQGDILGRAEGYGAGGVRRGRRRPRAGWRRRGDER